MQKRRKYSEEFKREAVSFANQPGVTARQVGDRDHLYPYRRALSGCGNLSDRLGRDIMVVIVSRANNHRVEE